MPATRRLAAILAADVAGYSRLMGADEEGTLRRLQAHRRELIDPKIAEHRGRLVKTTGAGLLVEFASVVDAVRCAVEVQRGMIEREAEAPAEQALRFRVGINLGDIISDQGDIFGDGVNVAARLEALAEPGGACISGTVRDHVGDRLPYAFTDMGEQNVKNIARAVRVFAIEPAAIAATSLVPPRPPPRFAMRRITALAMVLLVLLTGAGIAAWRIWPPGIHEAKPVSRLSIVVLPLASLSNDPDQEYFADAVTDDLTTDLSRIANSFVISRTTAFTYKGKSADVKQIGRELGVRYVLEGSVRRLGEQVQVNVQLIDAETGAHVWADRFDTDRTNLAKAQREITGRLARTLHLGLLEAADRVIEQEKPVNLDARDLLMRGWAGWYKPETAAQLDEAQRFFEQALTLDPQSSEARIGSASILVERLNVGMSKSRKEDMAHAEQLLLEALEHAPNDARLHFAIGMLRRIQERFIEAKIELEKTIALDHNHGGGMLQLGFTLIVLGEPEVALPYFEKAIRLNPQHKNIAFFYFGLGSCNVFLDHLDEAIDFYRKARAANSRIYFIHFYLSAALALRGDIDEAKVALAEFRKLKPELRSLADLHRSWTNLSSPPFAALWAKTVDVGLLRAGFPAE
jgi:adenylate cyclase